MKFFSDFQEKEYYNLKGTPCNHTNINDITTDGVVPKVLNFKKVYMITHRRSGLLISKFAL